MAKTIKQININENNEILLSQNENNFYYVTPKEIRDKILENVNVEKIIRLSSSNGNLWGMLLKNTSFIEKEFYPVVYNLMKEKYKVNDFEINQNIYRYILKEIAEMFPIAILEELKERIDLTYEDISKGDSFGIKSIFSSHGIKVISSSVNSPHLIEQSDSGKNSLVYKISFMGLCYFVEMNEEIFVLKACSNSEKRVSEVLYVPLALSLDLKRLFQM